MYGIFTYIYHKNQPNVGKYTIHGSYGSYMDRIYTSHHGAFFPHLQELYSDVRRLDLIETLGGEGSQGKR